MDADQRGRNLPQFGEGTGPAVDLDAAFSVRLELPLDEQRAVLVRRHVRLLQTAFQKGAFRDGEQSFHQSAVLAGPDEFAFAAGAAEQADGVDQDAFPRAGLAGEYGKAVFQIEVQSADQGDILNMQRKQHGLFLSSGKLAVQYFVEIRVFQVDQA